MLFVFKRMKKKRIIFTVTTNISVRFTAELHLMDTVIVNKDFFVWRFCNKYFTSKAAKI